MIMALSAVLGMVHGVLEGWLEKNDIKKDLTVLQKACLLGIAKTLRYVLNTWPELLEACFWANQCY